MDDEKSAQRLAAWLNSPASTEPPEDLDPEVLGAVYALAPDRAPAPRVSIDDILGLVTEGPFAQGAAVQGAPGVSAPTTGSVVEFPGMRVPVRKAPPLPPELEVTERFVPDEPVRLVTHTGGRARDDLGAAVAAPGTAARRKPSRAWMMPTIGLALAAAAATLVVVPNMGQLSAPDLGELEAAREADMAPSAAAPAPSGAPSPAAIAEMAPRGNIHSASSDAMPASLSPSAMALPCQP